MRLITALVVLASATSAAAATIPVTPAEQEEWIRQLLPLPKQIAIDARVEVPIADVKLRISVGSDIAGSSAGDQLSALFKKKTILNKQKGDPPFVIWLGLCQANGKIAGTLIPGAAELAQRPNAEQAYIIRPIGDRCLVLAALDGRGLYYAVQTLCQLLENQVHDGHVSIPIATITDWPDLAERGEWGGSANQDIVWLSRYKMNLVETHVILSVSKDGRGHAKLDPQLIRISRQHALKLVPVITHLNGLARTGIYRVYPELRGKGAHAVHPTHKNLIAPCCSQPKFVEVLAEWMNALADQPGVTDICCWLSELSHQYCDCEKCRQAGVGQYALEARCLIKAYRLAQKTHPHLHLRILLTQGSYASNDKVLAEIPHDVGVTYYDGGRTYDSSRDPMIYPLLERYAAMGGWLGCYPQLTASWRIVCPWSCPQFIKYRMTEFVDKKLKCVCGYATPNNHLYEFNVLATAEWAWNAHGRSERQFAAAWATRQGIEKPGAAAQWAVTLGPAGWDVYGSRIPYPEFFGRATAMISRRRKPKLGAGMFRYFPTVEHITADLIAANKALAIAKQLDRPELISETIVIQGYLRMVKAIYLIAKQVAESKNKKLSRLQRIELQKQLNELALATMDTTQALDAWERACSEAARAHAAKPLFEGPQLEQFKPRQTAMGIRIGGARFQDTIDRTEQTAVGIAHVLQKLGLRNPISGYLREEIGRWETKDFDRSARITKQFDVTSYIAAPGIYHIGFRYTNGWNGLSIRRVALVSKSAGGHGKAVELSVDEHRGSAAVKNHGNVYTVELAHYDPAVHYYVVADIRGTSSRGRPPERQGCNGVVWIKGTKPSDWRQRIEAAGLDERKQKKLSQTPQQM